MPVGRRGISAGANREDRIILHRGNALAIIPALDEVWDIVFYRRGTKWVMGNITSWCCHGCGRAVLIIADNVLFHGQVLGVQVEGKSAKAIQAFNELVGADVKR